MKVTLKYSLHTDSMIYQGPVNYPRNCPFRGQKRSSDRLCYSLATNSISSVPLMTRITRLAAALLLALVQLPGLAEPAGQASQVVESLNSALLDVMQNAGALGYRGRYEKLAPVIEATHDIEYIARFSIGNKNWENLSAAERKKFVDSFTEYSIATYASRFNGYSGETFQVTGEQPAKRGQVRVDSLLEIPGEETVDFIYLLLPDSGNLKIVNIIVQGVSDLALKRAEFMSLINDKGIGALLALLAEKTAEYAAVKK
jgi:phospholipid transport system substrate-binding protein